MNIRTTTTECTEIENKMSKIVYLGQYAIRGERRANVATVTLMDYVIEAICHAGHDLSVVSYADREIALPLSRERINDKAELIYLSSVGDKQGFFKKSFARIKRHRAMIKELCDIIEDGDTVIAYHSLALIDIIKELRRKRSFRLILQVCEKYSDFEATRRYEKKELGFISTAEGYIFSSNQLCKRFNSGNKPYVICMGTYNAESVLSMPPDDGVTHAVYAGTFSPNKGGVFNAIRSAEYLDKNYHLHILGGAEDKLFKLVAKTIIETSLKTECQITYDGFLTGDEYKAFLQSCHIGLSTQDSEGAFNDSSFPSKILVYLANGLKVVSSKIPAVTTSAVDSAMYYYDYQSPREIAKAIMEAKESNKSDSRELVEKLNRAFIEDIKILLGL